MENKITPREQEECKCTGDRVQGREKNGRVAQCRNASEQKKKKINKKIKTVTTVTTDILNQADTLGAYFAAAVSNNALFSWTSESRGCEGWVCSRCLEGAQWIC